MTFEFHNIQKIEIIVKGEKQKFVEDLLESAGAKGYTIIQDIAGKGEGGLYESRLLFNDQASLVMFLAVASAEVIEKVATGLAPLFEKNSGVMFVSDAKVARLKKFL